jgi:hypothetical protein
MSLELLGKKSPQSYPLFQITEAEAVHRKRLILEKEGHQRFRAKLRMRGQVTLGQEWAIWSTVWTMVR